MNIYNNNEIIFNLIIIYPKKSGLFIFFVIQYLERIIYANALKKNTLIFYADYILKRNFRINIEVL